MTQPSYPHEGNLKRQPITDDALARIRQLTPREFWQGAHYLGISLETAQDVWNMAHPSQGMMEEG